MIRKSPEQSFDPHTTGAAPEYCAEVIKLGVPQTGQASTAMKLGAEDSRNWTKSSRRRMSPGAMSASDDRFTKWTTPGSRAVSEGFEAARTASRPDASLVFRSLLPRLPTAYSACLPRAPWDELAAKGVRPSTPYPTCLPSLAALAVCQEARGGGHCLEPRPAV